MGRILLAVAAAGVIVVGIAADAVQAFSVPPIDTVVWVGGASGEWNDANSWKNTTRM